jgi:hypothetical protein
MKIKEFNNKTRVDEIDCKSLGSAIKKSLTTQASDEKVQIRVYKSYINTMASSIVSYTRWSTIPNISSWQPPAIAQPNTANKQSSTSSQLAQSRQKNKQRLQNKRSNKWLEIHRPSLWLHPEQMRLVIIATQLQPKAAPTASSSRRNHTTNSYRTNSSC